jgi:hypothetical protein
MKIGPQTGEKRNQDPLRLLREPHKRADRPDAYRCRLLRRFRDHYSLSTHTEGDLNAWISN